MKKRVFSLLLFMVLVLTIFTLTFPVSAYQVQHTPHADKLNELGLFKGSTKGYELDRPATRVEALVMLIRLLGKEGEALATLAKHPFTDVPGWADPYVAYAYSEGLTKGTVDDPKTGTHLFGTGNANNLMYLTFSLRALGYSDAKGDFRYETAYEKATEIGITKPGEYANSEKTFYRDDCVKVSFSSLTARLNNSDATLAQSLIRQKAIDEAIAIKVGVAPDKHNSGEQILIPITLKSDGWYSSSPEEIRSVIPSAAKWSFSGTNAGYSDSIDNHIACSDYFLYLLDNSYISPFDDPLNPHERQLSVGRKIDTNSNLSLVVFDSNKHLIAYGYGKIVIQDGGKNYLALKRSDYDISDLFAKVDREWKVAYQNATKLSPSDFYTTNVTFTGTYTDEKGELKESKSTKTLLKIADSKFEGDIASTAYMLVAGTDSGLSDKLTFLFQWVRTNYSSFKGDRFARNDYIHYMAEYPEDISSSNIRGYETAVISLYDRNYKLLGWAVGRPSGIPSR